MFAVKHNVLVKSLCTFISVSDDAEEEQTESFQVSLSTTENCVTVQSTPSTIIIVDNDNDENDATSGSDNSESKTGNSKSKTGNSKSTDTDESQSHPSTSKPKSKKLISEDTVFQPNSLGGFDPVVQTETGVPGGIYLLII